MYFSKLIRSSSHFKSCNAINIKRDLFLFQMIIVFYFTAAKCVENGSLKCLNVVWSRIFSTKEWGIESLFFL